MNGMSASASGSRRTHRYKAVFDLETQQWYIHDYMTGQKLDGWIDITAVQSFQSIIAPYMWSCKISESEALPGRTDGPRLTIYKR